MSFQMLSGQLRNALTASLLVFLTTLSGPSLANVRIDREDDNSLTIAIEGRITSGDVKKVADLSDRFDIKSLFVHLDSEGGDADAAMEIGRLVRRAQGFIQILPYKKCYSSCALIFMAGSIRINIDGVLGLHRPYLAGSPSAGADLEKKVPQMLADLKRYVEEMRVTPTFYEKMVNTEPSSMILLGYKETKALVPVHDPVYDEQLTAAKAQIYGIATDEARKRDARADKKCSSLKDSKEKSTCQEAVMWGISPELYGERYARLKPLCWLNEKERFSEENEFIATPTKQRLAAPYYVNFLKCEREVMRGRR
jgi:hypothetical protein